MKDVTFGLIGGAIGAAVWAGVVAVTQYEIGWIAWGVGGLVGYAVAAGNSDKHRSPTAAGYIKSGMSGSQGPNRKTTNRIQGVTVSGVAAPARLGRGRRVRAAGVCTCRCSPAWT